MLDSAVSVVQALLTYTDWWQPTTASVLQAGGNRRRTQRPDGFRAGLVETLDERVELCRRMVQLTDRGRQVLFLWYVAQLPVREIARAVGVSQRQCFRLRGRSVKTLVDLGKPSEAA